jgi:phage virion morphogenesis protein
VISGEISDREVLDALTRLQLQVRSLRVPFTEIGRLLKTSTQLRFRDQVDPQGVRWIPSKRVEERGGQTLRLTGRLRNSLTYVASDDHVDVGTNVEYGKAHQFGLDAEETVSAHTRKIREAFGRRLKTPIAVNVRAHSRHMRLPARQFLGMSQADRQAILDQISTHLRGGLPPPAGG